MAKSYKPNDNFDIVTIQMLVPHGEDGYMDALSDLRDDHPELLLEWDTTKIKENLSVSQARMVLEQMDSDTEIHVK